NAVGDRLARPRRGLMTRPTLDEVLAYRAATDSSVLAYLESAGDALPLDVAAVVELGINHEQQHQELILTDIKHARAENPLAPAYGDGVGKPSPSEPMPMTWSLVEGGLKWIGHDGPRFAFDNECPRHREYLESFHLGSRLVTSGEYIAFIAD